MPRRFALPRTLLAAALAVPASMAALPALAQDAETGAAGTVETRSDTFLQRVEDMHVVTPNGDKIGEIEEILIDSEGRPAGFLIETGGFLGLGNSDVAVPLEALTFDKTRYVSKMTEEQLKNLRPFDE